MSATRRIERHFAGSGIARHVVIGMADGPTVPFALAAGAVARGFGGYLAARSG